MTGSACAQAVPSGKSDTLLSYIISAPAQPAMAAKMRVPETVDEQDARFIAKTEKRDVTLKQV